MADERNTARLQRRIGKRYRIDVVSLLRQAGGEPPKQGTMIREARAEWRPVSKVLNTEIILKTTLK
ncbi:MAG TPA: hypothetical protein VF991_10200 [Reyranella sp.]